jgi:hypothetical protein
MTLRAVDFEDIGFVLPCSTSTAQRECLSARSGVRDGERPQVALNATLVNNLSCRMLRQLMGMDC